MPQTKSVRKFTQDLRAPTALLSRIESATRIFYDKLTAISDHMDFLRFIGRVRRDVRPYGNDADGSEGGIMDNGITRFQSRISGRAEINDPKEFERLTIRPSKEVVREIEKLEELNLVAEHRLGNFMVG